MSTGRQGETRIIALLIYGTAVCFSGASCVTTRSIAPPRRDPFVAHRLDRSTQPASILRGQFSVETKGDGSQRALFVIENAIDRPVFIGNNFGYLWSFCHRGPEVVSMANGGDAQVAVISPAYRAFHLLPVLEVPQATHGRIVGTQLSGSLPMIEHREAVEVKQGELTLELDLQIVLVDGNGVLQMKPLVLVMNNQIGLHLPEEN